MPALANRLFATQIVPLTIAGAKKDKRMLMPIAVPDDGITSPDKVSGNIAKVYRRVEAEPAWRQADSAVSVFPIPS
jgi:hypothetical protein